MGERDACEKLEVDTLTYDDAKDLVSRGERGDASGDAANRRAAAAATAPRERAGAGDASRGEAPGERDARLRAGLLVRDMARRGCCSARRG